MFSRRSFLLGVSSLGTSLGGRVLAPIRSMTHIAQSLVGSPFQSNFSRVSGEVEKERLQLRDLTSPSDEAQVVLEVRGSQAQCLGPMTWRGQTWLAGPWPNTLLIRSGIRTPATDHLRNLNAPAFAPGMAIPRVYLQNFSDSTFVSCEQSNKYFSQIRAVWHLHGNCFLIFDSARAKQAGNYTLGTAWRWAQSNRLKSDDMLLLENDVEDQFSQYWFGAQGLQSEVIKHEEHNTSEVIDLLQASAADFAAGQRWAITNVLVPHRKPTYKVRRLTPLGMSKCAAVEVEQPGEVNAIGVQYDPGWCAYGWVESDAEAVLAQRGTTFKGSVRVKYVNGSRIRVQTGLKPETVVLKLYGPEGGGHQEIVPLSESPLQSGAWKYAEGWTEVEIPKGSGELELSFAAPARKTVNLNQDWRHLPWEAEAAWSVTCDDSDWQQVQLPYSVAAEAGKANVHWYRKHFRLPAETQEKVVLLEFEAVAIQCLLWVNGRKVGEHLGAFNTFRFDITDYLNPSGNNNVVAARVDFSPSWRHKIPFLPEGYNNYGGIYRDVWLTYTDTIYVESVFVTTPELSETSGKVKVQALLKNRGKHRRIRKLVSVVYNMEHHEVVRMETTVELRGAESKEYVQLSETISNPRLWSPESPVLYTVVTQILIEDRAVDEVRNTIGFRWYHFDPNKGFFLNGHNLKLHGANMHQGYPYLGNAVPNSKMPFDLYVLKRMGGNFLRTTHITMDPVVIEMADRLGLLVWEEIPVAGFGNGRMGDPFYDDSAKEQLREMIRRDRNHPCIIIWSLMNEAAGGESKKRLPAILKLCRELNAIAKHEDPTRLTAVAQTVDAFFGITDISGRNNYFRGYNMYELGGVVDQLKRDHPNYRFMISEFGAPNVERGHFGAGRTDTEEYGVLVHEYNSQEYEKRSWVAGYAIWVAFDYFLGEPHEGVMDEARYPKDDAFYYQGQWALEPMLRIRSSAYWTYPGKQSQSSKIGNTYDVAVDSNCDRVELFLNGRSQGVKKGPGPFVWRQMFYVPGTLCAVGKKSGARLEHRRSTAGKAKQVELRADVYELAADGRDVAYLRARLVDGKRRLVRNSYDLVQFSVEGEGELVGPATHNLQAGLATLASVRATTKPGDIRVRAKVRGYAPGELIIRSSRSRSSVEYEG